MSDRSRRPPDDPDVAALIAAVTALAPTNVEAALQAGADPVAAATAAAHAAAAELEALRHAKQRTEDQLNDLFETVTAFAALEYDRRAIIHEGNDDITNAMAIGLNMMGEELTHTMDALVRVRDEALAASRSKSAFLANISHELRTPLNAIIGYAEMLREELMETGQVALTLDLDRLMIASRHLLSLIQDILDLSRIEAGRVEIRPAIVDLKQLIADLTATLAPNVAAGGNHLTVAIDVADPVVWIDPLRLQQVLLNILGNANKFTRGGEIRLAASDAVCKGQAFVAITVADTGIGIPADKLEAIFEAFTQADEAATRRFGGTGLGLTISRRLCELLGGTISVVSELGHGSTFTVCIPAISPPATP